MRSWNLFSCYCQRNTQDSEITRKCTHQKQVCPHRTRTKNVFFMVAEMKNFVKNTKMTFISTKKRLHDFICTNLALVIINQNRLFTASLSQNTSNTYERRFTRKSVLFTLLSIRVVTDYLATVAFHQDPSNYQNNQPAKPDRFSCSYCFGQFLVEVYTK